MYHAHLQEQKQQLQELNGDGDDHDEVDEGDHSDNIFIENDCNSDARHKIDDGIESAESVDSGRHAHLGYETKRTSVVNNDYWTGTRSKNAEEQQTFVDIDVAETTTTTTTTITTIKTAGAAKATATTAATAAAATTTTFSNRKPSDHGIELRNGDESDEVDD